jgi:hypothetical protein
MRKPEAMATPAITLDAMNGTQRLVGTPAMTSDGMKKPRAMAATKRTMRR